MPHIEWSMLVDLGLILLGVVFHCLTLLLLLRVFARQVADLHPFKAFLLVGVVLAAVAFTRASPYGERLEPYISLITFMAAFVLLHPVCRIPFWHAFWVAMPFALACIGLEVGMAALSNHVAPDRRRIADVHRGMVERVEQQAAADTNRTASTFGKLTRIVAGGLEGLAFFATAQEQENMARDLANGLEAYRERKALLESGEVESMTYDELLQTLTGMSATNNAADLKRQVVLALAELEAQVEDGTNPPPPEVVDSMRVIAENLADPKGPEHFRRLMATATVVRDELRSDAGRVRINVGALEPVAQPRPELASSGTLADAAGALTPTTEPSVAATVVHEVVEPPPEEHFVAFDGGDEDAVLTRLTMQSAEGLVEGTPVEDVPDALWQQAQQTLQIAGLMSVSGKDVMVLVNGELRYKGDTVRAPLGGTTFWWRITGAVNKNLQLQRLAATTR